MLRESASPFKVHWLLKRIFGELADVVIHPPKSLFIRITLALKSYTMLHIKGVPSVNITWSILRFEAPRASSKTSWNVCALPAPTFGVIETGPACPYNRGALQINRIASHVQFKIGNLCSLIVFIVIWRLMSQV
jgi:hypothetical protein